MGTRIIWTSEEWDSILDKVEEAGGLPQNKNPLLVNAFQTHLPPDRQRSVHSGLRSSIELHLSQRSSSKQKSSEMAQMREELEVMRKQLQELQAPHVQPSPPVQVVKSIQVPKQPLPPAPVIVPAVTTMSAKAAKRKIGLFGLSPIQAEVAQNQLAGTAVYVVAYTLSIEVLTAYQSCQHVFVGPNCSKSEYSMIVSLMGGKCATFVKEPIKLVPLIKEFLTL